MPYLPTYLFTRPTAARTKKGPEQMSGPWFIPEMWKAQLRVPLLI